MESALALTSWDEDGVSGMTYLDSGRDGNYSGKDTAKLLINASGADGQTHVLFRAPEGLFGADPALLAKATVTFRVTRERDYDGRSIWLQPLAAGYEAAETTWLNRATNEAWSVGGGEVLDGVSVAGKYDAEAKTLSFDLLPLLTDEAARAAFEANGVLVRLDETERPEDGSMMFQLPTPLYADDSLQPEVFWAELDPYEDVRDFALSYIDSRDASTVYWEQGESFVGKVILNGEDGSECRAILTMPESLAAADPSRVQSVVAKFDAEIRDYEGEAIFLAPLTTGTWLERHPNNQTLPVHGPSWNWADGAVDTNATSFVVDDVTYDNAAWEVPGGDWMADFVIQGTVTPPASGTTGTAEFDLTKLWHDDTARANLIANGAIVYLDPEAFDQAKEDKRMARVNLFRPDDVVVLERSKHSWVRVTEYEQFAAGSDVTPLTAFRIDSESPDTSYFGQGSAKIVMNFRNNTETRAFCALPEDALDEDLPALDSYTLRFNGGCKDDGDKIPVLLSPVACPFGTTDELRTTWNSAWTNPATGEAEAWTTPGGDIGEFSVAGLYDTASGDLTFNLADLQRNEEAALLALANGVVMRFDPDQTAIDPESQAMPRITIGAAGEIIKARKTVATTYIDSSSPTNNFSSNGKKTLVVLNKLVDGAYNEARTLAKLSPELLDVEPNCSVNLLISYFRSWPGDDGVNPVALHPATTAFRLDEATWLEASAGVPWETAGGDFLDAHVTAADSTAQSLLTFDIAPLLADADSAAALAANGAVIRMLGNPPEASSNNGYNVNGSLSSDVPVVVLVPAELAVRGIGTDAETGALTFSVAGLDPLHSYVLESATSLEKGDWTTYKTFPRSGELSVVPNPETGTFFRILQAD
jgi:hypothetical protein